MDPGMTVGERGACYQLHFWMSAPAPFPERRSSRIWKSARYMIPPRTLPALKRYCFCNTVTYYPTLLWCFRRLISLSQHHEFWVCTLIKVTDLLNAGVDDKCWNHPQGTLSTSKSLLLTFQGKSSCLDSISSSLLNGLSSFHHDIHKWTHRRHEYTSSLGPPTQSVTEPRFTHRRGSYVLSLYLTHNPLSPISHLFWHNPLLITPIPPSYSGRSITHLSLLWESEKYSGPRTPVWTAQMYLYTDFFFR